VRRAELAFALSIEDQSMPLQRLKCSLLASFALLSAGAAQAADYAPPPPPMIVQQPVEEFASWYLRGDIGFSNQRVGSFISDTDLPGTVEHIDKSFDSAPFFGVGIGYNFNEWLRFDVTGEFRGKANFHGFDIARNGGGFLDDRHTASKSEWTFLLNGYVDLGTWHSVTPFVGAGIGFSRNTISNFGDIAACVNSLSCADAGGSDAFAPEASKWNFAWALHAGLAYKVSKNFTVELAYRFLDLGDAETGIVSNFDRSQTFGPFRFQHLTSHDLKLGVRFNLDSFAESWQSTQYYAPQTYAPAPVYTQPPVYQQQPAYTQPPVYQQPPAYSPPLRSRG
jgi:opacity protein-like surface antigen